MASSASICFSVSRIRVERPWAAARFSSISRNELRSSTSRSFPSSTSFWRLSTSAWSVSVTFSYRWPEREAMIMWKRMSAPKPQQMQSRSDRLKMFVSRRRATA